MELVFNALLLIVSGGLNPRKCLLMISTRSIVIASIWHFPWSFYATQHERSLFCSFRSANGPTTNSPDRQSTQSSCVWLHVAFLSSFLPPPGWQSESTPRTTALLQCLVVPLKRALHLLVALNRTAEENWRRKWKKRRENRRDILCCCYLKFTWTRHSRAGFIL